MNWLKPLGWFNQTVDPITLIKTVAFWYGLSQAVYCIIIR